MVNFEKYLLNDKLINLLLFPTYEEVYHAAKSVEGTLNKDGKTKTFYMPEDDTKENYVDLNKIIDCYFLILNSPKNLHKRKKYTSQDGNIYFDRFYYTLSGIPKFIRNLIKIKNEKSGEYESIKEIDATALHPRIVGKLSSEYFRQPVPNLLRGDVHTKIGEFLGVERKTAKQINLSYWNSKIIKNSTVHSNDNAAYFSILDKKLKDNYPHVWEYLNHIKREMNNPKHAEETKPSNSSLSVLLFDTETRLMQRVISRLEISGIKCIYTYDCVSVIESEYIKAKEIFDNEIEFEFGDIEYYLNGLKSNIIDLTKTYKKAS
jgi:hypothetical protein